MGARTALRLALAQIRHRPLRAGTVALAVLVATACVATVVVLDRNTVLTRQWIAVRSWGDPDLVATFRPATLAGAHDLLARIRAEDGIDAVLGILRVRGSEEDPPVYVVIGDLDRFLFLDVRGPGLEAGSVVLGPAARSDVLPPELGALRASGAARAGWSYFLGEAGADARFVPGDLPGLAAEIPVLPTLWIRSARPDDVRARLAGAALVQDAPHRTLWRSTEDSAMRAAVRIAGLLALVLCAFVLAHVTRVGLLERSRELAVLRALGAPRGHLLRLGLLEIALVAVPAAAAAIPLGAAAAHALGRAGISTLGRFKVWFMDFPEGAAALVLLAGIVLPLLGAWISLRTVLRLDAAAALGPVFQARPPTTRGGLLRDAAAAVAAIAAGALLGALVARVESPEVESVLLRAAVLAGAALALTVCLPAVLAPVASLLGAALGRFLGVMGRLAARSGAAGGRGFLPALVGVVGVFAIVLTLKNLVGSMQEEIAAWGRVALVDRAGAELTEGLPAERLERAREALPDLVLLPVVAEWRRPVTVRAMDLEPLLDSGLLAPGERELVSRFAAGEGVIASRAFAVQHRLRAGGEVLLATTGGARRTTVLAVTDRFGALGLDRGYLLVGPRFATAHLGVPPDARPRRVLAWTRDGRPARPERLRALAVALGTWPVRTESGADSLRRRLDKTRIDFRVFDAVWAFLVLLATVGVGGTILLRALERRRELALLRVLGATRAQLRLYFTAQGLGVGLVGGLLALVLAVPFTAVAVWGLRRVSGMDVAFVYSLRWAVVGLALSAGLGGAAGLLASVRARRIDWASALKYE